jgi:class 3 adenylate cyclase/dihydrofolate reductase
MRLILSAFMTLDGVMEGPGFDEHRDGRNAWALRHQRADDEAWNVDQVMRAHAILLGRKTYQIWAAFWPTSTGDDDFTRRMNEIPKYVASRTLERADWSNTTILRDAVAEVAALKTREAGELILYGSADLADDLIAHELIDEYRVMLFPVVLGSGKHLFADRIDTRHLSLVGSQAFSSGVVLLTYVPATEAPTSQYEDKFAWTDEQTRSLHDAERVNRVLATVLFTDLVGSTASAASMGDRAWRRLLDRHDEVARNEAVRWLAQHVESNGDGLMATFDTPTRALGCAFGLRTAVAKLGLELRVGLHTGEIERHERGVGGVAVHLAARVVAHAGPAQVLVTRTVRDMMVGSDITFRSIGTVALKGVPGEWELLEALPP